jgi:hypothetical protein
MEITKIKIENNVMSEICNSLFTNNEEIKETCSKTILPIKSEIVDLFFEEYQNQLDFTLGRTTPYISLISDNATNELQIHIRQCDADTKEVTISDIGLKSRYFHKCDDGQYNFIN